MTANVVIYTTHHCPYCVHAKQLLDSKQVKYTEIYVDTDPAQRDMMVQRSGGRRTVPQIFINDHAIGGFDDIAALAKEGKLDALLAQSPSRT